MSGPTRGTAAGKQVITHAQNAEYDEGFERIFGKDRKPQRGRFVWDEESKSMVEVGGEWTDAPRRAETGTEELTYGNATASDGTLINTRKRHREYLKATGLAMAGDFSPAYQEKQARSRELAEDKSRRETVERAFYKHRKG